MPILWEPTGEVDGEPVRGVRVSAEDWARAHKCSHEIRRRGVEAGVHARREACHTQGGAMTEQNPDYDTEDGGAVVWAVGLLCLAFVLGACAGVAVLVGRL